MNTFLKILIGLTFWQSNWQLRGSKFAHYAAPAVSTAFLLTAFFVKGRVYFNSEERKEKHPLYLGQWYLFVQGGPRSTNLTSLSLVAPSNPHFLQALSHLSHAYCRVPLYLSVVCGKRQAIIYASPVKLAAVVFQAMPSLLSWGDALVVLIFSDVSEKS